jgi:anthranilate/para-aminobenzoate synthase component II
MLLMIDNYDSFTYNIVQYFGELNQEVKVVRNDAVTLEDIERWQPKYLVIGPGLVPHLKQEFPFLQFSILQAKFHWACV